MAVRKPGPSTVVSSKMSRIESMSRELKIRN
jgi:hypothetical protein